MPKIKLYVETGFAGCKHVEYYDFPDEDWNSLSEMEKEKELDSLVEEYLWNRVEAGAYVVTE